MPSIVSGTGATASSGLLRDARVNDDRFHLDVATGLAFVVDASGPVYGGYHAPFAIDPGIDALVGSFSASRGATRDRLVAAVHAAHDAMRAMHDRYETQRAGRLGLEAARAAADAVRPAAWATFDSLSHFMGSLTACAVGPDGAFVAQIGECRAYGLRDGVVSLLAQDHTLPSVLEASGASREEVERARRDHANVVVAMLGGETLPLTIVEVPTPATIVLATNGAWRCEDELARAFHVRTQQDLASLVAQCAARAQDDATAVVLDVR
jgi:hypothetical protein